VAGAGLGRTRPWGFSSTGTKKGFRTLTSEKKRATIHLKEKVMRLMRLWLCVIPDFRFKHFSETL
jgi:hypothetical protein